MKVLLSIKPQFASKIFSGEKRYEFRKAIFRNIDIVKTVIVYSSSPEQKVIGEFSIESIMYMPLYDLWNETELSSGITKEYFDKYFEGRKCGYAIEVGEVKMYEKPLALADFNIKAAPQSFCYIK